MTEIRTAVPDEVDGYLDALVKKGIFANKAELVRAALVNYVNATGTVFRGFDAENIFSPNGRVYQLEYAREAAMRGGTIVGVVCEDGALLAAETVGKSKVSPGSRKIRAFGDRLAVTFSGLAADAELVMDELDAASPKATEEAVRLVRTRLHRQTLERMQRPLGVAFLIASALERKPKLCYVDPSGAVVESFATAVGHGAPSALKVLETRYRKMRLSDAERMLPDLLGRDTPSETVRVQP